MTSPQGLFAARLAASPESPLVTWYDETPGRPARVELSARSVANWAAKSAGLFGDELGSAAPDAVYLDPVSHWLVPGVLVGAWQTGLAVLTRSTEAAAVAVLARGGGTVVEADEVFTFDPASPLQLGAPDDAPGAPPGSRDLPTALRPHPDRLGPDRGHAGSPALDDRHGDDLTASAGARATDLGLTTGAGRLLWSGPLDADGIVDAVLAPWTVGGSLVLVAGDPGAERLAAIAATEGVDVVR